MESFFPVFSYSLTAKVPLATVMSLRIIILLFSLFMRHLGREEERWKTDQVRLNFPDICWKSSLLRRVPNLLHPGGGVGGWWGDSKSDSRSWITVNLFVLEKKTIEFNYRATSAETPILRNRSSFYHLGLLRFPVQPVKSELGIGNWSIRCMEVRNMSLQDTNMKFTYVAWCKI